MTWNVSLPTIIHTDSDKNQLLTDHYILSSSEKGHCCSESRTETVTAPLLTSSGTKTVLEIYCLDRTIRSPRHFCSYHRESVKCRVTITYNTCTVFCRLLVLRSCFPTLHHSHYSQWSNSPLYIFFSFRVKKPTVAVLLTAFMPLAKKKRSKRNCT